MSNPIEPVKLERMEYYFTLGWISTLMTNFKLNREDAICVYEQMLCTTPKLILSVKGLKLK